MKKNALILMMLVLLAYGCKKEDISPTGPDKSAITDKLDSANPSTKLTQNNVNISVTFLGGSSYHVSIHVASEILRPDHGYTYTISGTNGFYYNYTSQGRVFDVTLNFPPGGVYDIFYTSNGSTFWDVSGNVQFPIAPQPLSFNPAGGYIFLYRYLNESTGKRCYTTDWSEYGGFSNDYLFEKVVGYLYDSPSRASNLVPLYRYYNASQGDFYLTTQLGTYNGWVYQKIIGYISTVNAGTTDIALNEYYSNTHFYAATPETAGSPYNFSKIEGYITPPLPDVYPGGVIPLFRYYNENQERYFYTSKWSELGAGIQGWAFSRIEGYLYDNATRMSNLTPLYRYYNAKAADHYYTITSGNYGAWSPEGITGYVSTVQTLAMNQALDEYYSPELGHVYTSPAEPLTGSYKFDSIQGYLQATPTYTPPPLTGHGPVIPK